MGKDLSDVIGGAIECPKCGVRHDLTDDEPHLLCYHCSEEEGKRYAEQMDEYYRLLNEDYDL